MMKRLILLYCFCALFSCKKQNAAEDITKYNWVLNTAVVNPAITIGSKTSTDYKNLLGAGSCLASNYTLVFLSTGIYQFSSNGALCDMVANNTNQKWKKEGNIITLSNSFGSDSPLTVNGNAMVQTTNFTKDNVNYTIVYTYTASLK